MVRDKPEKRTVCCCRDVDPPPRFSYQGEIKDLAESGEWEIPFARIAQGEKELAQIADLAGKWGSAYVAASADKGRHRKIVLQE